MERRLKLKAKDLSVRDHIAIQVLPILLATSTDQDSPDEVCDEAIRIADILEKKLNSEYIRRHRRNDL
jgi:hypothetical protein